MEITRVSIILPTYNGEKFISGAIESVLAQSYKDWNLLVIDDGSTDKTAEIVKEFSKKDTRIKYFRNERNLGIQKTLNRGLKLAQGEYIARIDDDDRWIDSNKLKKQVEFLDNNYNYVLIGTGTVVVDKNGRELFRFLNPQTDEDIRKRILSRNCFTHSSVMFRKKEILRLGGYDETKDVQHSEDYNLWLGVGMIGKFTNLSIYATQFTMHKKSISFKNKFTQLKRNISISKKYKDFYPNYPISFLRNIIKLMGYIVFRVLPFDKIGNSILKRYKEM